MYVASADSEILHSKELRALRIQYEEKFGERFMHFNYADFPGTETQLSAEMYKETLEKALLDDKPYHIVSHRYDDFDH